MVKIFSRFLFISLALAFAGFAPAKTLMVLGDSLSAAYEIDPEKGWVNLLSERMKDTHPTWNVVNLSFGGATTNNGLRLLPEALKTHQPELLLLELGANDGLQGKPVKLITQNLQKLIDMAQNSGAEVVILGVRLPPNYGTRYTQPFYDQYGTLASENNLLYVPFILDGVAGNPALMRGDGLHPNEDGQPIILENIWPTVKPLLDR